MNTMLFISMFLGLGIFYLVIGVFVSKKISTISDYFLAGRDLGLAALTFTLIATQIGGGMLLGSADVAYYDGYFGVFYSLGMSAGFLLLGFGLASKLRQFEVATTAELFQVKYNSTFLRKIASAISAVSMMGIFAAQVVASRALFKVLGIEAEFVLILFWVFVLAYTMLGGLKAVVTTDIYQVIFLIAIVTGVFAYSIFGGTGFVAEFVSLEQSRVLFTDFGSAFVKQLPIFVTSALYPLFGQDLVQRFFAARTKRIAVIGALLAAVILVFFAFVPVYFGMKARMLGLVIPAKMSVFYLVVRVLTNDVVFALVGCALIAAITSTADSLLCAISSNVMQDFEAPFIKNERKSLVFSKGTTLIAGLVGMGIAYFSQNILSVLSKSYGLLISCLFIPVLFCFFSKRLSKKAAGFSVFFGALTFGILELFSTGMFDGVIRVPEIIAIILPLLVSCIGYGIGYFMDARSTICQKITTV